MYGFKHCKQACLGVVCLALGLIASTNSAQAVNYSCTNYSNVDLVNVAAYNHPAIIGPANFSANGTGISGLYYRDFITLSNTYRFRQSGSATSVKLFFQNPHNYATGVYIKIWRRNGASFDLIATSENILPSLGTTGAVYTVNFAQALTGIQEGDYYGYRLEAEVPAIILDRFFLAAQAVTLESGTNHVNQSTVGTTFDWEDDPSIVENAFSVPMEFTMTNPDIAFIGDSIIAGHPAHYSYLEKLTKTNLASTISYNLGLLTSYVTQNFGIGSQTTTMLAARFNADVLAAKPRVVVIEGGVNDIANGVALGTFTTNVTNMVTAAQGNSSVEKIVLVGILPWSNGTNLENTTVDTWNAVLSGIASSYSKAVYVSAASMVGQFRVGGPVGNLRDIQPAYDADGVHFTPAGSAKIAQAVRNVVCDPTLPLIVSHASGAVLGGISVLLSGTATIGDTITIMNASGVVLQTTITNAFGAWATTVSPLVSGINVLHYYASDALGNVTPVQLHTLIVDLTAPARPTIITPAIGTTLLSSTVVVNGTGEAGAVLSLYNASGTFLGSGLISASGTWTVTVYGVAVGSYVWSATARDPAGNISLPATTNFSVAAPAGGGGFGGGAGGSGSGYVPPVLPPVLPLTPTTGLVPITPLPPKPTTELKGAFEWSKIHRLTDANAVYTATGFLEGLTRIELARIMVLFEYHTMHKNITANSQCDVDTYSDAASIPQSMRQYVKGACNMGLMGWKNNKQGLLNAFRPNDIVTRAELAAVLVRYFYNDFAGTMASDWYTPYLNTLHQNNIMHDISNPKAIERKGYLLLMLQRYQEGLE